MCYGVCEAGPSMKAMTPKQLHRLNLTMATRVMGFKLRDGYAARFNVGMCQNEGDYVLACLDDGTDDPPITGWSPTTDYAQALMVLEKCHRKLDCEDVCIGWCTGLPDGEWYLYSTFREDRIGSRERLVYAPTLPLAICKFAEQLFGKEA